MNWPTWNQAALAALISGLLALVVKRWRPDSRVASAIGPAALEFALVSSLYSLWRIARKLPLSKNEGAMERAYRIVDFERWLHLPTELSLQHFVLRHEWLGRLTNYYYAGLHVPTLLVFLVWMYVRHREDYPHWRNGLVLVTAGCLVIRFIRVAPPRFLTDLGYIDLSSHYGLNLYGPVGTGVSDQFAAMPSIHIAWAAVVSFGIVAVTKGWWRWLFLGHLVITFVAVSATGNHWWLDGIVAVALLGGGLAIDSGVRKFRARGRVESQQARQSGVVDDLALTGPDRGVI